jgi:putative Holliday junction resolvase
MRLLGIDFGTKRVGLAVSDGTAGMAFPLKTIERTTREALFDELLKTIEEERVGKVIVGLPLDLSGQETLSTRQAANFAASLKRRTDLPVVFADERLSSAEAEDRLHEAGVSGKSLKKVLDSQAAVLILESYLEHGEIRPDESR